MTFTLGYWIDHQHHEPSLSCLSTAQVLNPLACCMEWRTVSGHIQNINQLLHLSNYFFFYESIEKKKTTTTIKLVGYMTLLPKSVCFHFVLSSRRKKMTFRILPVLSRGLPNLLVPPVGSSYCRQWCYTSQIHSSLLNTWWNRVKAVTSTLSLNHCPAILWLTIKKPVTYPFSPLKLL